MILSWENLAKLIDHSCLKSEVSSERIKKACEEALSYGFFGVAVNPTWISLARKWLKGSEVKIIAPVGFPLGASTLEVKLFETQDALDRGADEIDFVLNIGKLKSGEWEYVEEEMVKIADLVKPRISKVILETFYLTREEKIRAAKIALKSGVSFVKTSTGFAPGGATLEDVRLLKEVVGGKMGVKASGGIRTYKEVVKLVGAGATRLGTTSSVKIMEEAKNYLSSFKT